MIKKHIKTPWALPFLLLAGLAPLNAQITLSIDQPRLAATQSALQDILNTQIEAAVNDLNDTSSEYLDYVDKPLLTSSLGRALGTSAWANQAAFHGAGNRFALTLGAGGAFVSDTFKPEELLNRMEKFKVEDDFLMGVGANGINVGLSLPLDSLARGLYATGSAGYLSGSFGDILFSAFSLSLGGGYVPWEKERILPFMAWIPLTVQLGTSYGTNRVAMKVQVDTISQEFPVLDPDGPGPLIGQSVTVNINDPSVTGDFQDRVGTLSVSAATGIGILDFFMVYGGAGAGMTFGETGFTLESREPIEVAGYLGDFIVEEGSFSLTGDIAGASPFSVAPFLFGGLALNWGYFTLNLPLLYEITQGLSLGVTLGAAL